MGEETIHGMEQRIVMLEQDHRERMALLEQDMDKQAQEHDQQLRNAELAGRSKLQEFLEQYRQEFTQAGLEAQRVQGQLQARVKQQEDVLNRLKGEYEARPPRPQDVERITELEHQLADASRRLEKALGESELLGLEVVNQDQTLRVLFKKGASSASNAPPSSNKANSTSGATRLPPVAARSRSDGRRGSAGRSPALVSSAKS